MSSAHAGSSPAADRVDLVDKHDAGLVFLRLLEEVPHTGGADAHEHLHKIRAGNGKEGNSRFPRYRPRQKRLAGSGRAHQNNAFRYAGAHFQELFRLGQELDNLRQLFLFLIKARHVVKCDLPCVRRKHPGAALSEIHHHGTASAALLPVEKHDQEQEHDRHQNHRQNGSKEDSAPGYILHIDRYVISAQQLLRRIDVGDIHRKYFIFCGCHLQGTGRDFLILDHIHSGNFSFFQHMDKPRLRDVASAVEAVAQRENQKDADHSEQKVKTRSSRSLIQTVQLLSRENRPEPVIIYVSARDYSSERASTPI